MYSVYSVRVSELLLQFQQRMLLVSHTVLQYWKVLVGVAMHCSMVTPETMTGTLVILAISWALDV